MDCINQTIMITAVSDAEYVHNAAHVIPIYVFFFYNVIIFVIDKVYSIMYP